MDMGTNCPDRAQSPDYYYIWLLALPCHEVLRVAGALDKGPVPKHLRGFGRPKSASEEPQDIHAADEARSIPRLSDIGKL